MSYRRLFILMASGTLLLFLLAFTFHAIGIHLAGSAVAWLHWLDEHTLYLFVWRLCLYAAATSAWFWKRRRFLQRRPETRQFVQFLERLALPLVLTDPFTQLTAMRQQILLSRLALFEQVAHDLLGLHGEWDKVWRNISGELAVLAHLKLELLDDLGGNDPEPLIQMKLIGSCQSKFACTDARQ